MLSNATLALIEAHWCRELGIQPEQLRPDAPLLIPHGPSFEGYCGIYVLCAGPHPLVSAPQWTHARLAALVPQWSPARSMDSRLLRVELRALRPTRFIGPVYLGYSEAVPDPRSAPPRADGCQVRAMEAADVDQVAALRAACSELEWEHGGGESETGASFGAFAGKGHLGAMARWEPLGERLAQLYVLTHPLHRGQGFGRAVVRAATESALESGRLPQYQTLDQNQPSVAVAGALGFIRWATAMAIRLTPPE